MRVSLPALLCVGLLGAGLLAAPAGSAATSPAVGAVEVAGDGPGDLMRATGTGFAAKGLVTVAIVGADDTVPLLTVKADDAGGVTLPQGTRTPSTLASGRYRLTMTQSGVSSSSPSFDIFPPTATLVHQLQPGRPAAATTDPSTIRLTGLADSPDVTRALTIDGVPTSHPTWFSDDRAFDDPGFEFDVPADLRTGSHQLVFTQTGSTPFSVTLSTTVPVPFISVPSPVTETWYLRVGLSATAWNDDFDLTATGATGDRVVGRYVVTRTPDGTPHVTVTPELVHLSGGLATMTAVSRVNGATVSTTFTVLPSSVRAPGVLGPGQRLTQGVDDTYVELGMDGNLVEHGYNGYVWWSSGTAGHPGASVTVQDDGNVVLRTRDGRALWSTRTNGIGAGARLGLDDGDGDLSVYTASGRRAWSSFGLGGLDNAAPSRISAGGYLFRDAQIRTDLAKPGEGRVSMTVRADGDLVVGTSRRGVRWSTHTAGHLNDYLVLQTDGNLVLRTPTGAAIWANGVRNVPGARLVAQPDGNVVEYAPSGRAVWSTRTNV